MPGYVIAIRERIRDADAYRRYKELAPGARGGHTIRRLTSTTRFEVVEGAAADGATILEFPSYEDARDWYYSAAYQEAMKPRLQGADFRMILVDDPSKD